MREYILWWNSLFPLDYWYRKRYKIPFNSQEHQSLNQLDIYFEFAEGVMFDSEFIKIQKERVYKETRKIFVGSQSVYEEREKELLDIFWDLPESSFDNK